MRAALVALCLAACAPVVDDDSARVAAPRVIAARAEPAEAAPGERVRVSALVAAPPGVGAASPAWALCLVRPALASASPVSDLCREDNPAAVRPLGDGDAVELTLPTDACARFGPDPPVGQQSNARPADPDLTGGYALPLRVRLRDGDAFAAVRLRCNLGGATREVAAEFRERSRPNENPALTVSRVRGAVVEPVTDALRVARGERVTLRASWPTCAEDVSCAGAETYLRFDPETRGLLRQREAMRASWFASAGRFDVPRTGRARDDRGTDTDNVWTAPEAAGEVALWVVLRDERGGAVWRAVAVTVQ